MLGLSGYLLVFVIVIGGIWLLANGLGWGAGSTPSGEIIANNLLLNAIVIAVVIVVIYFLIRFVRAFVNREEIGYLRTSDGRKVPVHFHGNSIQNAEYVIVDPGKQIELLGYDYLGEVLPDGWHIPVQDVGNDPDDFLSRLGSICNIKEGVIRDGYYAGWTRVRIPDRWIFGGMEDGPFVPPHYFSMVPPPDWHDTSTDPWGHDSNGPVGGM